MLKNHKVYAGAAHHAYKQLKLSYEPMVNHSLTNQSNAQTIFRRKKGRKWKKQRSFAQRVLKATQTFSSEKTWQLMRSWAVATAAGTQQFNGISFYGGGVGDADMVDLFQAYDNSLSRNARVNMKSAHVDYLCSNVGIQTIVLKVYTIVPKKDIPYAAGTNVGNFWVGALDESVVMPGTTVGLDGITVNATASPGRPGNTPFDSTVFCQNYTVLKCTEYVMTPGQVVSFNDSMMRKGPIDTTDFDVGVAATRTNQAIRGWTKTHLFVFHGIATTGGTTTLASAYPVAVLNVIGNKTYKFTVTEQRNQAEIQSAGTI